MCQGDHGKYCINYRSRYGLLGLNHAVSSEKVKSGLLDWNHVTFLKKVKTWTTGFELCSPFIKDNMGQWNQRSQYRLLGLNHVVFSNDGNSNGWYVWMKSWNTF